MNKVAYPAGPPDDHIHKGRRVRWAGWHQPANQFVMYGYWVADGEDAYPYQPAFRYATTLGVCDAAQECDCLATNRAWSDVPVMPEPHERDALKARALQLLYEHL